MQHPDSSWSPSASDPWEDHNSKLSSLIARCRTGDVRAFEELYVATVRWMLARIRRMVDDGQAEDVLAEVYIQVWKSLDSYDERRAPPASWLAMIARSRALDHLRREKHRRGEEPAGELPDEARMDDGPEQMLSRSQDAKMVQLSLATLDEDERLVLGLAYFHDCTQPQISSMTGMPLGTVKSLVYRAQQKLRKCFAAPKFHAASLMSPSTGGASEARA
ncbi:MAG: sigma-70 family RNA polymerase sigma factor [Pseudomonadota bacterium]